MKCVHCNKESSVKIVDKYFCKSCFIKHLEGKISKTIRRYDMLSKKDKLFLVKDNYYQIILYILKKITGKTGQEIKLISKPNQHEIIISTNLDDIASTALSNCLNNKNIRIGPKEKNIVRPLYFCSSYELKEYARIKNLKFKAKKDKVTTLLEQFEKRYPGTINSIVNSYLEIIK